MTKKSTFFLTLAFFDNFKHRGKMKKKLIPPYLGMPYQKVIHILNGYLPATKEVESELIELLGIIEREGRGNE